MFQAVCDANPTQTPRVGTPAQPSTSNPRGAAWTINNDSSPANRRQKHQPNPPFDNHGAAGSNRGRGQRGQRSTPGQQSTHGSRYSYGSNLMANGTKDAIRGSRGTKKRNTDRNGEGFEAFPTHNDWTAASGEPEELSNSRGMNSI